MENDDSESKTTEQTSDTSAANSQLTTATPDPASITQLTTASPDDNAVSPTFHKDPVQPIGSRRFRREEDVENWYASEDVNEDREEWEDARVDPRMEPIKDPSLNATDMSLEDIDAAAEDSDNEAAEDADNEASENDANFAEGTSETPCEDNLIDGVAAPPPPAMGLSAGLAPALDEFENRGILHFPHQPFRTAAVKAGYSASSEGEEEERGWTQITNRKVKGRQGETEEVEQQLRRKTAQPRERRLVLVYLHDRVRPACINFSTQVLSNRKVKTVIRQRCELWAREITDVSDRDNAIQDIRSGSAGSEVAERMERELGQPSGQLPLYLVGEVRGEHRVLAAPAHGFMSAKAILRLVEDAHLKLLYEEQEEARDLLREEQDRAFAAAMERDRQRLEEEEEASRVSRQLEELSSSMQLSKLERKEQEAEAAAARLPHQPEVHVSHIHVRLVTPGGQVSRRFLPTHTLANIYDLMWSQNYSPHRWELVAWPSRVLTLASSGLQLCSLNLGTKFTLHIQPRDR